MRFTQAKAALGIAAIASMLVLGSTASAAPISKCNATKKKCIGKYIAAVMGCHAKAESKSLALDGTCVSKAVAKITGGGKGCFDKADVKGPDCSQTGDATTQINTADAFILDVVNDIDPGYPAPHTNKCDAGEKKCVGKKAAALMGCKAKENKDGVGDPTCEPKAAGKFTSVDGKGCFDKIVLKNDGPCDGATAASIETKTDNWADASANAVDTAGGSCGNGANDAGEACDASAPSSGWASCGSDFTCVNCNCACPKTVVFSGDATAPESILDTGWTGISHRAPIISNGDVTVSLSCSATQRPCGTCNVAGPIPNPQADAGQLNDRRCSQDSSRKCTSDAQCTSRLCLGGPNNGNACTVDSACPSGSCPAAGFCSTYFGSTLPLAAGGVTTCVSNQFNGNVSGTANVESGEATTTAFLTSRVFNGIAVDNPCPRCSDGGAFNDGLAAGGTCDGGPRIGLPCDANGAIPGRPDFGRTSLDCPPNPAGIIATLPINLSNATDSVTRTLTAASPNCAASPGDKCLCNTCNSAAAEPCFSNADCTTPGHTICGGKRCLGGANIGAACATNSECPASSCAVPGEPTKPSGCLDDTTTVNTVMECSDAQEPPNGDGEGGCTVGPVEQTCSVASGHAQRGCLGDADCGGGSGSCVSNNRRCFLTGGGNFNAGFHNTGTNTLIAVGMADTPVRDTAHPVLGAVFCVGPTGSSSINNVAGLPGPSRITIKGTAVAHP